MYAHPLVKRLCMPRSANQVIMDKRKNVGAYVRGSINAQLLPRLVHNYVGYFFVTNSCVQHDVPDFNIEIAFVVTRQIGIFIHCRPRPALRKAPKALTLTLTPKGEGSLNNVQICMHYAYLTMHDEKKVIFFN